jgi:hypothetical protein
MAGRLLVGLGIYAVPKNGNHVIQIPTSVHLMVAVNVPSIIQWYILRNLQYDVLYNFCSHALFV